MHLVKSHLAHAAAATLKNHLNGAFSAPFSAPLFLAARTASCTTPSSVPSHRAVLEPPSRVR